MAVSEDRQDDGALMTTEADVSDLLKIESPEGLTREIFSQLLERQYDEANIPVSTITFRPFSHAILSNVAEIEITFDDNDPQQLDIPRFWIAKFQRPTLPLDDMFRVEGTFYSKYSSGNYPFRLASMLYFGDRCIVLEKVLEPTIKYDLLQSLPMHLVSYTISVMAQMHAVCWGGSYNDLSPVAGIGTALTGMEKEQLFPLKYEKYIQQYFEKNEQYTDETVERLKGLCDTLAKRRLREIHDAVHAFQPTMIHGDFHVGNLLFPKNDSHNNKLWLLDWATCGAGNPLIDLVFFFIVSTRVSFKEFYKTWLPHYYKVLTTSEDVSKNGIRDDFSWNKCLELVRTCVLNQFVILVCYDEMSRNLMATQSPSQDVQNHFLQHFENVNQRCVEALLSPEMSITLPSLKTEQDLEAEKAAQNKNQETELLNL